MVLDMAGHFNVLNAHTAWGNPKTQVDRCFEFECITKHSKEIGDLSGT